MAFVTTATRDTGNKVERSGGEEILAVVLHGAYELELSLGTIPGAAAYAITKAALRPWICQYYEQYFGSWSVRSPDGSTRIDYDARDFFLLIQGGSKTSPVVLWQGRFSAMQPLGIGYFQTIQDLFMEGLT